MPNNSDHNKPQFDITKYLPEVYRSDVNSSLFNMVFNRHLTKDDTQRVAGIIGESSQSAIVKRQIQESSPHRQAYQLAPTMYSKIGTIEAALSYKAFLQQLSLMGVSTSRLPKWADTLQFNWVPPINLDMFVNYQDYFWMPRVSGEESQYFTIENRCSKLKSKLASYDTTIESRGTSFSISKIDLATNQFILNGRLNDLFVDGFVFFTSGTTNVNIADRFWTVDTVAFDEVTQQTSISLIEPIAIVSENQPSTTTVGRWWFNPTAKTIRQWNGSDWTPASVAIAASISLAELRAVYQSETNCACTGGTGWDLTLWDDNQVGAVLWDQDLFSSAGQPNPAKRIDFATSDDWINWNAAHSQTPPMLVGGVISDLALWYDTTNDQLKQFAATDASNPDNADWTPKWMVVVNNFSALRNRVTGTNHWDETAGCEPQSLNQWSDGNRWIHKTEVKSFGGVKRAQMPILEYNSGLELNQWTKISHAWKYRPEPGLTFESTTGNPHRLELEPITGYSVAYINNIWYVYLFNSSTSTCRDVNYTSIFTPGFQFRVVDDTAKSDTYTVHSSELRMMTHDEPTSVLAVTGRGTLVTVVRLTNTNFVSPLTGGGQSAVRIEPRTTSKGTPWRGYHIHWVLDTSSEVRTAMGDISWNHFRTLDLTQEAGVALIKGNSAFQALNFHPSEQVQVEFGTTYQELILSSPSVRQIDLLPSFQYTGTEARLFATPASNELRVYLNGVRQYGTYSELTSSAPAPYTAIGSIGRGQSQVTFVTGIVFDRPLKALDIVRMEVGPASFDDMGMYAVPVRTVEDDNVFAALTISETTDAQPVYMSLTSKALLEQVKISANQNPLFNVYDLVTNDVIGAAPIFNYKDDASAAINTTLHRRVAVGTSSTDYVFTQDLVDRDNNILFGYRDNTIAASYWYNPTTSKVLQWDGKGWTDNVAVVVDGVATYRTPVVSAAEPNFLLTLPQSLWFDTRRDTLFQRLDGSWTEVGCVVNVTDPTIRTIWRRGSNNERAIPQYVDKDKNEVTVGSPDGDWGIVDQWIYNPEHQNRKELRFAELFTHLNSILRTQPKTPGLQSGGVYALSQSNYNYGLGGTIKEHNGSFDTLISAVNVSNVTPPGVLEYAAREYASSLLQFRDMFTKLGPTLLADSSNTAAVDLNGFLTSRFIAAYQSNDSLGQVFGDSSSYDAESGVGVRNWIATAPMFGLAKAVQPHLNQTAQYVELVHHDGHRSVVSLTVAEIDRIARTLCNTIDPATSTSLGKVSTAVPPTTATAMTTQFGGMRRGSYWYRASGSVHKLYRFESFTASTSAPPNVINGLAIPNGTMYFNLTSQNVYQKVAGAWVAITVPGQGDISPLWREIDLSTVFGQILLEVEQRLYDAVPSNKQVFDYSTLTSTTEDAALYDQLALERFGAYARNNEITAPLVNVQYVPTDAYTWNYSACTLDTPPHNGAAPEMASSWKEVYARWYGTPYPHLEPWKLQGFTNKPDWWDASYLNQSGARRWVYSHATKTGMWENIRKGVVPTGKLLPDGFTVSTGQAGEVRTYTYFCVNISDANVGNLPPDSLFPPYFAAETNDPTVRSMFGDFVAQLNGTDSDFTFGDGSFIEWDWKNSLEYVYDQMIIAFEMQPMRFMQAAFGPQFTSVDGLDVDVQFKQVYSHTDAMFHGDVYGQNVTYISRGLNQWYVNYNRRAGYNTNGEFREMWAGWKPTMTHQFGGIIDTNTFEIANKYIDVIPHDYSILLVNNGVFKDLWMDAFEVSLINIPPPIIQYNNQSQWKVEVDSLASSARTISYYGVKEYGNVADPVLTRPMNVTGVGRTSFVVDGNQLNIFYPGNEIDVTESDLDNGTYTVRTATYDPETDQTTIEVLGSTPSGGTAPPPPVGIIQGQNFSYGEGVPANYSVGMIRATNPATQWRFGDSLGTVSNDGYFNLLDGELTITPLGARVPEQTEVSLFPTQTIQRMLPKYFTVDGPRSMSFALTTAGKDLSVDFTARLENDLCGLIWSSEDTKDHTMLKYSTNRDYRGMVWTFDLEVSDTAPMINDEQKAMSLTVQGRDENGNPVTYIVALFRYADVPASRKSSITIDFDTVMAGFSADVPMYVGDVDSMFISCITSSYVNGSFAPLAIPEHGWVKVTGSTVTGSNSTMTVGVGNVPAHSLGMCTSYDDHYDQSPERILDNTWGLGYRGLINHYCGMSIFPEKLWDSSQNRLVVVTPNNGLTTGVVNDAARKWHSNLASLCLTRHYDLIQSVSYETYSENARYEWTQRDWDSNFAQTGYVPPSYLLSPCVAPAMEWMQTAAVEFATAASQAGLPVRIQVGEPWWWYNPGTNKPCIYDTATRNKFNQETGLFAPDFGTIDSTATGTPYDEFKVFLNKELGESVQAVRTAVKTVFPSAEVSVLPFLPTIVGKGIMEAINLSTAHYAYPNFDRFQTEAYDYFIGTEVGDPSIAMTYPIDTLGYPPSKVSYLAGFAPDVPPEGVTREDIWKRIFTNTNNFEVYGVEKQLVWAYTIIMRDSVTYVEHNALRAFFYDGNYTQVTPNGANLYSLQPNTFTYSVQARKDITDWSPVEDITISVTPRPPV